MAGVDIAQRLRDIKAQLKKVRYPSRGKRQQQQQQDKADNLSLHSCGSKLKNKQGTSTLFRKEENEEDGKKRDDAEEQHPVAPQRQPSLTSSSTPTLSPTSVEKKTGGPSSSLGRLLSPLRKRNGGGGEPSEGGRFFGMSRSKPAEGAAAAKKEKSETKAKAKQQEGGGGGGSKYSMRSMKSPWAKTKSSGDVAKFVSSMKMDTKNKENDEDESGNQDSVKAEAEQARNNIRAVLAGRHESEGSPSIVLSNKAAGKELTDAETQEVVDKPSSTVIPASSLLDPQEWLHGAHEPLKDENSRNKRDDETPGTGRDVEDTPNESEQKPPRQIKRKVSDCGEQEASRTTSASQGSIEGEESSNVSATPNSSVNNKKTENISKNEAIMKGKDPLGYVSQEVMGFFDDIGEFSNAFGLLSEAAGLLEPKATTSSSDETSHTSLSQSSRQGSESDKQDRFGKGGELSAKETQTGVVAKQSEPSGSPSGPASPDGASDVLPSAAKKRNGSSKADKTATAVDDEEHSMEPAIEIQVATGERTPRKDSRVKSHGGAEQSTLVDEAVEPEGGATVTSKGGMQPAVDSLRLKRAATPTEEQETSQDRLKLAASAEQPGGETATEDNARMSESLGRSEGGESGSATHIPVEPRVTSGDDIEMQMVSAGIRDEQQMEDPIDAAVDETAEIQDGDTSTANATPPILSEGENKPKETKKDVDEHGKIEGSHHRDKWLTPKGLSEKLSRVRRAKRQGAATKQTPGNGLPVSEAHLAEEDGAMDIQGSVGDRSSSINATTVSGGEGKSTPMVVDTCDLEKGDKTDCPPPPAEKSSSARGLAGKLSKITPKGRNKSRPKARKHTKQDADNGRPASKGQAAFFTDAEHIDDASVASCPSTGNGTGHGDNDEKQVMLELNEEDGIETTELNGPHVDGQMTDTGAIGPRSTPNTTESDSPEPFDELNELVGIVQHSSSQGGTSNPVKVEDEDTVGEEIEIQVVRNNETGVTDTEGSVDFAGLGDDNFGELDEDYDAAIATLPKKRRARNKASGLLTDSQLQITIVENNNEMDVVADGAAEHELSEAEGSDEQNEAVWRKKSSSKYKNLLTAAAGGKTTKVGNRSSGKRAAVDEESASDVMETQRPSHEPTENPDTLGEGPAKKGTKSTGSRTSSNATKHPQAKADNDHSTGKLASAKHPPTKKEIASASKRTRQSQMESGKETNVSAQPENKVASSERTKTSSKDKKTNAKATGGRLKDHDRSTKQSSGNKEIAGVGTTKQKAEPELGKQTKRSGGNGTAKSARKTKITGDAQYSETKVPSQGIPSVADPGNSTVTHGGTEDLEANLNTTRSEKKSLKSGNRPVSAPPAMTSGPTQDQAIEINEQDDGGGAKQDQPSTDDETATKKAASKDEAEFVTNSETEADGLGANIVPSPSDLHRSRGFRGFGGQQDRSRHMMDDDLISILSYRTSRSVSLFKKSLRHLRRRASRHVKNRYGPGMLLSFANKNHSTKMPLPDIVETCETPTSSLGAPMLNIPASPNADQPVVKQTKPSLFIEDDHTNSPDTAAESSSTKPERKKWGKIIGKKKKLLAAILRISQASLKTHASQSEVPVAQQSQSESPPDAEPKPGPDVQEPETTPQEKLTPSKGVGKESTVDNEKLDPPNDSDERLLMESFRQMRRTESLPAKTDKTESRLNRINSIPRPATPAEPDYLRAQPHLLPIVERSDDFQTATSSSTSEEESNPTQSYYATTSNSSEDDDDESTASQSMSLPDSSVAKSTMPDDSVASETVPADTKSAILEESLVEDSSEYSMDETQAETVDDDPHKEFLDEFSVETSSHESSQYEYDSEYDYDYDSQTDSDSFDLGKAMFSMAESVMESMRLT